MNISYNFSLTAEAISVCPSWCSSVFSSWLEGSSDLWKIGLQLHFQSTARLLLCSKWHVPIRRGYLRKDETFVAWHQHTERQSTVTHRWTPLFIKFKVFWGHWPLLFSINSPFSLSDNIKVAFKATMDPNIAVTVPGSTERCFGPFNINIPVPFSSVLLNSGNGYNPSLGKTHRKRRIQVLWLLWV